MARYVVTTPAAEAALSLADGKKQLRLAAAYTDEDDEITALIAAAQADCEVHSGRFFVSTAVTEYFDAWPMFELYLRFGPVSAVTSVKYYDEDGTLQTLSTDDYYADLRGTPARISLVDGVSWPTLQTARPSAIEVLYSTGWADAASVPENYVHAIRLTLADFYEERTNRGRSLPTHVRALLYPDSIRYMYG